MINRFKILTAALGFVLLTGTLVDASAKTIGPASKTVAVQTGKTSPSQAPRAHRQGTLNLRHARKVHVAHHRAAPKIAAKTVIATKTSKLGARQRHALLHRTAGKASVIR